MNKKITFLQFLENCLLAKSLRMDQMLLSLIFVMEIYDP